MVKHMVSTYCLVAIVIFVFTGSAQKGGIVTKEVTYKSDGPLKGYLAYDGVSDRKRPGVLVVHEWWGLNEYPKMRARMLADLGYVAMAVDMYGNGKVVTTPDSAGQLAGIVRRDQDLLRARFMAALNVLRQQPAVDTSRIAAIGYCFGGSVLLSAGMMGVPLDGIVSFHGTVGNLPSAEEGEVQAKVLVCNGAADPTNPPEAVAKFKKQMDEAGVVYHWIDYPNALHAFSNPASGSPEPGKKVTAGYNEAADKKSWEDMKEFLSEVFGK